VNNSKVSVNMLLAINPHGLAIAFSGIGLPSHEVVFPVSL